MKDDLEVPRVIPAKRRALEAAPDLFLAVWLNRDDLSPSERRRVQAERDSRKAKTRVVGYFVDAGHGMTPEQRAVVRAELQGATLAIHRGGYEGGARRFHGIARNVGVEVKQPVDESVISETADVILATPRESAAPSQRMDRSEGVWAMVRHARRRGVHVKVIRPDGTELGVDA